jgi:DNA-binding IclR family transcriptional regulator
MMPIETDILNFIGNREISAQDVSKKFKMTVNTVCVYLFTLTKTGFLSKRKRHLRRNAGLGQITRSINVYRRIL